MKDRGKRTAMERRNDDVSLHYSSPSELSCGKHPSVSTVGICPYCLNDRLVNLVCSGCGEQRLSSCSCSDISSNRTSNAAVDAEKVLRIASLIDEEATKQRKPKRTEEVVVFKRSSSSCVEINKTKHHHRFSRLGRFFRRINPRKDRAFDEKNNNDNDSWVLKQSVSRSRSLCSFRGGNGYLIGSEEDVSSYSGARSSFSAARSSSVNGGLGVFDATITEHRRSNFEGRKSNFSETTEHRRSNFSEPEPPRRSCFEARKSNFSETEYPRKSNFSETEYKQSINNHPRRSNYEAPPRKSDSSAMSFTRRVLSMKESYFTGGEEPGFIDLKFDSSGGGDVVVNDGVLEHGGGGSCRLTKKDREAHVKPNTIFIAVAMMMIPKTGSNKHHEDDLELQGQQKLIIAQ
ncbi:hypothetical protein HID58_049094 [Brassica napus]|uniref:Uncharacterized protein n=1 Tax=Brassica napus TaxID=3708 RepID=A0ABQ8B5G6_BRANA|nr:hypothetical protein HID58_090745 [Brassica napus]KAH0853127.1 hypothetical protein HID58_093437 [Brassica napus]KAH0899526.1 hypothetical protein HID58_049094 [Brassica napus]